VIRFFSPTRLSRSRSDAWHPPPRSSGSRPSRNVLARPQPAQEDAHEQSRCPAGPSLPGGCSRDTATLVEWMTCTSMPRACSHRASQNPSRPLHRQGRSVQSSGPLHRLGPPALQQPLQRIRVRRKLLQGLAIDAGTIPATSQLDSLISNNHCQAGGLIKGNEGAAQVVNLGHGDHPSVLSSDDDAKPPAARPIASSVPTNRRIGSMEKRQISGGLWVGNR